MQSGSSLSHCIRSRSEQEPTYPYRPRRRRKERLANRSPSSSFGPERDRKGLSGRTGAMKEAPVMCQVLRGAYEKSVKKPAQLGAQTFKYPLSFEVC